MQNRYRFSDMDEMLWYFKAVAFIEWTILNFTLCDLNYITNEYMKSFSGSYNWIQIMVT